MDGNKNMILLYAIRWEDKYISYYYIYIIQTVSKREINDLINIRQNRLSDKK